MKNYVFILFLSFVFLSSTNGQSVDWIVPIKGIDLQIAQHIKSDLNGNLFVAGALIDTTYLDTNASTTPLFSNGGEDVFLAKYDTNGSLIWGYNFGGLFNEDVFDMAVDIMGNVYIVGYFSSTMDVDFSSAQHLLTPNGFEDGYIIKYNPSGQLIWANSFGSTNFGFTSIYSVTLDGLSNVIVTGEYEDTVDFDPSGSVHNLNSLGFEDIFVAKYNTNGQYIWAKSMGSASGDEIPYSVSAENSGNIYVVAEVEDSVYVNDSVLLVGSSFGNNALQVKLDGNGNYIWGHLIEAISPVFGTAISPTISQVDMNGNLYVTGDLYRTVDFDPGPGVALGTNLGFFPNTYISKYDRNGNFLWADVLQSDSLNGPNELDFDPFGNLVVSGPYSGIVDMDPSPSLTLFDTATSFDGYVCWLDPNGNYLNHMTIENNDINSVFSNSYTVNGKLLISGDFMGNTDFDTTGSVIIGALDFLDGYVAQYEVACQTVNDSLVIDLCDGDSIIIADNYVKTAGNYIDTALVIDSCYRILHYDVRIAPQKSTSLNRTICEGDSIFLGGIYRTISGSYIDTFQTVFGCDSMVTTNLSVNQIDVTVDKNNNILTASAAGLMYQWLDCNQNYAVINGENSPVYEPINNGSYAIEITDNVCVDTSICYDVTGVGINENSIHSNLKVYPNPTSGRLLISSKKDIGELTIVIRNAMGQIVNTQKVFGKQNIDIEIKSESGIYLLELKNSFGETYSFKVLKQ